MKALFVPPLSLNREYDIDSHYTTILPLLVRVMSNDYIKLIVYKYVKSKF